MKKGVNPMSPEEIRERLQAMDDEEEAISAILDEIAGCEVCGKCRKDGARAGCLSCIARDVMQS